MHDAGTIKPGGKVYIPINTFTSDDPAASVTASTWANTDCHIHKDGGTTQRGSSAGETLTIDFDSIAGGHMLVIDLANNTTADFYQAGSTYHVRIEGVTVDAGAINAWIGMFKIGYDGAVLDTFLATLASQTSFTLNEGPAEASALVGCPCLVHDAASKVQMCIGFVSAYAVTSKTVTLAQDPGIFTMAAKDNVSFFMPSNVQAITGTVANATNLASAASNYSATRGLAGTALPAAAADAAGGLPISDAGGLGLDAQNTNINDIETAVNALNDLGTADIDARLVAIGLDHLVAASVTGSDITNNSIFARLVSASSTADWDDYVQTTDSLQAIKDHIGNGTNLTEAGGTGDQLTALATQAKQDIIDTNVDQIETAVITNAAGTDVAADIIALKAETVLILADTDDIGVAGAGLTNLGGMSTTMKAQVESEVNDALVAIHLDHLLAVAAADVVVDGSVMAHVVSTTEDWSTFVPSTDALQAIRDRGDAAWTSGTSGGHPQQERTAGL